MSGEKDLSILFIGNSHTYCNDMPRLVKLRVDEVEATHIGWEYGEYDEEGRSQRR